VACCYIAHALAARGDGHLVAIGPASRFGVELAPEDLLGRLSLGDRVTIFYEYGDYNWRLGQFQALEVRPEFDLIYLDGVHTWAVDALAFLLAERLLAPGGCMIFSALHWSIGASPTLARAAANLPADMRDAEQVKLVCDRLVKPHPNIAEYWEDGTWAYARKRDSGTKCGADRGAARELISEQAQAVRKYVESMWREGRWQDLTGPHPITGIHQTV
jgi:hypothetical protein